MAIAQKTDILDQLRAGIEQLTSSEQWTRWLDVQRRFHHYSCGNCLLISQQRPDASQVAGNRRWQQLGRQVRKGEKGIAILAPVGNRLRRTVEDEDGVESEDVLRAVRAFRTAFVFDIAQTDGEPLPEIVTRRRRGVVATACTTTASTAVPAGDARGADLCVTARTTQLRMPTTTHSRGGGSSGPWIRCRTATTRPRRSGCGIEPFARWR